MFTRTVNKTIVRTALVVGAVMLVVNVAERARNN